MNYKKKIAIYSFYYKDTDILVNNDIYCPIMAGNALNPNQINIIGDDTGLSISSRNLYYSEITGIYWVWKNTNHDITGSCHYRRYFTAQSEPFDFVLNKKFIFINKSAAKKGHGLIYTQSAK